VLRLCQEHIALYYAHEPYYLLFLDHSNKGSTGMLPRPNRTCVRLRPGHHALSNQRNSSEAATGILQHQKRCHTSEFVRVFIVLGASSSLPHFTTLTPPPSMCSVHWSHTAIEEHREVLCPRCKVLLQIAVSQQPTGCESSLLQSK
jgi:hypothetical protein